MFITWLTAVRCQRKRQRRPGLEVVLCPDLEAAIGSRPVLTEAVRHPRLGPLDEMIIDTDGRPLRLIGYVVDEGEHGALLTSDVQLEAVF